MCSAILQLLLSTGFLLHSGLGIVENNELAGPPNIQCEAGAIEIHFRTTKQFSGKVYVKGSFNRPECRMDYSSKSPTSNQAGEIRIGHGSCNMDRQRTLAPDGVMFSIVLVISFHPLFVTKYDKIYSVKCLYQEVTHTVKTRLDVSMLPSEPLNNDVIVPSCSYTIRKDSLDGPILSYARVGEQVVHRWNCDSEQFGILVHSCIVEDGQGERQTIIDENGCHTDRRLLGDPTYAEALNMAYRESFVFKFADRTALRFKCGIRLCLKIDGGCDGVTPPLCINETRLQENSIQRNVLQYRRLRLRRSPKSSAEKDADLLSQQLYILDNSDEELTQLDGGHASPPHMLCLSLYTSAWTTYLIATGFLVSLTFALLQGHKTVCFLFNLDTT